MRANDLKLCPEWLRKDIRANFFSERVVMHQTGCSGVVESPSLEVFTESVDVVLTDRV